MTEDEVVQTLCEHFESLFPKVCSTCNRRFATLQEYIQITKLIGSPMSYDAELGRWKTTQPIGSVALANCTCGSTIGLSSESMPLPLRLELLNWLRIETQRRGVSTSELLDYLRNQVRKMVLSDPISGDT